MILKNIFYLLKQHWYTQWFRLFISIGKSRQASTCLSKILSPAHTGAEKKNLLEEREQWGKYMTADGNLRLITWKSIFKGAIKAVVLVSVIFSIIWYFNRLNDQIEHLKAQLRRNSVPILQKKSPDSLKLRDGSYLNINTAISPLISQGQIYFPLQLKVDTHYYTLYLSADQFSGQPHFLQDCRIARQFLNASGEKLFYLYNQESNNSGVWLNEPQMAKIEAELQPSSMVTIKTRKKLSCQIRTLPDIDAPIIEILSPDTPVHFLSIAPLSSIFSHYLWVHVRYSQTDDRCITGWIPILALESSNVEMLSGSDDEQFQVTTEALNFCDFPGRGADSIPEVGKIERGESIKFLAYDEITQMITSPYLKIQVLYPCTTSTTTSTSEPDRNNKLQFIGWIPVAKVLDSLVDSVETSKPLI